MDQKQYKMEWNIRIIRIDEETIHVLSILDEKYIRKWNQLFGYYGRNNDDYQEQKWNIKCRTRIAVSLIQKITQKDISSICLIFFINQNKKYKINNRFNFIILI